MRRRLLFTLAAAAALWCVVGVVSVPVASAYNDNVLDTAGWSELVTPADWPQAFGGGGSIASLTPEEEMLVADGLCGVSGIVGCVGGVIVATGGATIIQATWKSGLGSAFGSWLASLTGGYPSSPPGGFSEEWCPYLGSSEVGKGGVTTIPSSAACASSSGYGNPEIDGFTVGNGELLGYSRSGGVNCNGVNPLNGPITFAIDFPSNGCASAFYAAEQAEVAAPVVGSLETVVPATATVPGTSTTCATMAQAWYGVSGYSGSCYFVSLDEHHFAQALGNTALQPCGQSGEVACPTSGVIRSVGVTSGTFACGASAAPCPDAMSKADGGPEAVGIPSVECGIHADCVSSGGGTAAPAAFALPAPTGTETYASYVARLRALGFWGWIYEQADDMTYPTGSAANGLGPGALTEVGLSTGTGIAVAVPLYWALPGHGLNAQAESQANAGTAATWPATSPTVTTNVTSIVVEDVPQGYSPGTPPPPGSGASGIDMSPLTGMGFGCNFPFGVLCWINGAVSAFSATPVAPSIDWTIPNVDMGSLGTLTMGQHYKVDLGQTSMDTYMGWIRDIESFVLWAGAIWYVGSRLLGIQGGGDPSVSVDEAFNEFTA